jgi:hypothetical protein
MKPKTRTIEIRGEKWKVIFKKPPKEAEDAVGYCTYDGRKIYVTPDEDCLGTYIHEILHALFPQMNEESIVESEQVLMDALAKFPQEYLNQEEEETFEL